MTARAQYLYKRKPHALKVSLREYKILRSIVTTKNWGTAEKKIHLLDSKTINHLLDILQPEEEMYLYAYHNRSPTYTEELLNQYITDVNIRRDVLRLYLFTFRDELKYGEYSNSEFIPAIESVLRYRHKNC